MINGNNVILFELEMDSGAVTVKYDIQSRYICCIRIITTTSVLRNADQQSIKRIPTA